MDQISSLKQNINDMIENIPDDNNIFNHIKKKTLNSKFHRLEELEKLLKIEKYNIVFIGTVGSGKTTAISHLFNLIDKEEKK